MAEMEQLYTALRNADAAGDVDAARTLAAHIRAAQAQAQPAMPASPARGPVAPLTTTDKILKGIKDPFDGGAQLIEQGMNRLGIGEGYRNVNNWVADRTGLVSHLDEGGIDKAVRAEEQQYQARRAAGGESGFDGYRTVGSLLPSVVIAAATRGAAGAPTLSARLGLGGRMGLGAAQGAGYSALNPVTGEGDFWDKKKEQIAIGAGIGGALPGVVGAAARAISPNASKNASVALLRDEGVFPTIGQTLGGMANRFEEKLVSTPLLGDAIRAARERANGQFQAAAINRSLAPVGAQLPQGVAGRDAVGFAETTLKKAYDDVLTKIGTVSADQTFGAKLTNLGQLVNRDMLSREAKEKFGAIMSDVQTAFGRNGMLTSEGFKRIESQLGSDIRKLTSSQDLYDGRLAPAVQQLRQELRDLLRRQSGSNADELAATNTGWANFKPVQRAASTLGAEEGQFTPAQFQNAVRALDKSKDKGAFARGSALGQDLGDAGKSILGSKVPNSGTADRAMMAGGLGALLLQPNLLIPPLAASGMYLPSIQRGLVSAVSSRPAAAQPVADALRKTSPVFIPGLTQLLLNPGAK